MFPAPDVARHREAILLRLQKVRCRFIEGPDFRHALAIRRGRNASMPFCQICRYPLLKRNRQENRAFSGSGKVAVAE